MSEYRDFVSDFPSRCAELLSSFEQQARHRRREVTLMLCVAAPTIIVPLERLKSPSETNDGATKCQRCGAPASAATKAAPSAPGHPSRDWERFGEAKSALDDLCGQRFIGSPLWANASAGSWRLGELSEVSGDPDNWTELRETNPLGPNKMVKTVLLHLRNALAHANIFTRGDGEISQVIFLSKLHQDVEKFSFLAVAPDDFRTFSGAGWSFCGRQRCPRARCLRAPERGCSKKERRTWRRRKLLSRSHSPSTGALTMRHVDTGSRRIQRRVDGASGLPAKLQVRTQLTRTFRVCNSKSVLNDAGWPTQTTACR